MFTVVTDELAMIISRQKIFDVNLPTVFQFKYNRRHFLDSELTEEFIDFTVTCGIFFSVRKLLFYHATFSKFLV